MVNVHIQINAHVFDVGGDVEVDIVALFKEFVIAISPNQAEEAAQVTASLDQTSRSLQSALDAAQLTP